MAYMVAILYYKASGIGKVIWSIEKYDDRSIKKWASREVSITF